MTKFNRVDNVHCAPWLVIPTVYQDALSYEEQLNKFCYSLNQIIGNVNQLPDYIKDLISEYINSGEINDIIRETLSQYILNVKYPPEGIKGAVGDGTADDTEAIQGCIDYANKNGGMAVYFPSGKYLTDSLTVKNNVSLFGFDRYTTKVVLKGGATKALINSVDGNFSVSGMTLDGNAGNQVNDVNVLNLICRDVLLADLILEDGFKLLMWNGTGGYLQIDNVVCGNAVNKCFEISGNSKVTMNAVEFTQLSSVGGDYVIEVDSNHGYYEFSSVAVCDTCLMCSGSDNTFRFRVEFAKSPFIDNGERNNFDVLGVADYNKLTGSRSVSIGGNDTLNVNGESNTRVSGDRTLHIEGANTFAVDGNSTESVDGNKSSVVTGVSSDTYNGDRTVNGVNQTETFTGKKVINATDIVLNPVNPLTYRTPIKGDKFDYIEFKDMEDNAYKVLVENDKTDFNLPFFSELSGETDDEKFDNALSQGGCIINVNVNLTKQHYIKGFTSQTFIGVNKSTINLNNLSLKNSGAYNNQISFQNIMFRGTEKAIELSNLTIFVEFVNCSFNGFKTCFYMCDNTDYSFSQCLTIKRCFFENITNRVCDYNKGTVFKFINNYITSTCSAGITLANCVTALIIGNIFEAENWNLQYSSVESLSISDNYFECVNGSMIYVNDNLSKNVLISNNVFIYRELTTDYVINVIGQYDRDSIIFTLTNNRNYSNTKPLVGFMGWTPSLFKIINNGNIGIFLNENDAEKCLDGELKLITVTLKNKTFNGWSDLIVISEYDNRLKNRPLQMSSISRVIGPNGVLYDDKVKLLYAGNETIKIYDSSNEIRTYEISVLYAN